MSQSRSRKKTACLNLLYVVRVRRSPERCASTPSLLATSISFCARSLSSIFCLAYSCRSMGCGRVVKSTSRSIGNDVRPMPTNVTKKNQPKKATMAMK